MGNGKERAPKPTGVYLDQDLTRFIKVIASLNDSTVSQVVRDALLAQYAGPTDRRQGDSLHLDVRDGVRELIGALKAEVGTTQVLVETRPPGIVDEEWCAGSEQLMFAGWTLEYLVRDAADRLRRRIAEGCKLQFLVADPIDPRVVESDWQGRDLKTVILTSLSALADLEDYPSAPVEVRFHKGTVPYTMSRAVRKNREVELLIDLHPYRCEAHERLRLNISSRADSWVTAFDESLDKLWNDAHDYDWRGWVRQAHIG